MRATIRRPTDDEDYRPFATQLLSALDRLGVQPGERFELANAGTLGSLGGARKSDPHTSKVAAGAVTMNARKQAGLAFKAIDRHGERGLTAAELYEATGIEGIWKRTSELQRHGWIVPSGEERRNPKTGKMNRVYVATALGREAYLKATL